MKQVIQFVSYVTLSYIMIWIQLYGHSKWTWVKENIWWFTYLIGIPIAYLLTNGAIIAYNYYKDSAWAVMFIIFTINMIVYSVMNYCLGGEPITLKTAISLLLCFGVVAVQSFMK